MSALTTPAQIALFRLATLRSGLKLETRGLRMSRGPTAYAILKGMGYKGSRAEVLTRVTADVEAGKAAMAQKGTLMEGQKE
jgi:hypothetical protein